MKALNLFFNCFIDKPKMVLSGVLVFGTPCMQTWCWCFGVGVWNTYTLHHTPIFWSSSLWLQLQLLIKVTVKTLKLVNNPVVILAFFATVIEHSYFSSWVIKGKIKFEKQRNSPRRKIRVFTGTVQGKTGTHFSGLSQVLNRPLYLYFSWFLQVSLCTA